MCLNEVGAIVVETWRWLSTQYTYVVLDEWCVMPNHLHGILTLTGRGGSRTAPTNSVAVGDPARTNALTANALPVRRKTVGRLIGAFKTVSTKNINVQRGTPGVSVWQRNFWEHIVRDDAEMDRIRDYIRENPGHWAADPLNPNCVPANPK
jgi:putative transposase